MILEGAKDRIRGGTRETKRRISERWVEGKGVGGCTPRETKGPKLQGLGLATCISGGRKRKRDSV